MSFRLRLTVVATIAVAVTIVAASALVYALVRSQLRGQVDDTLRSQSTTLAQVPLGVHTDRRTGRLELQPLQGGFDTAGILVQAVAPDGEVAAPPGQPELPVNDASVSAARERQRPVYADTRVGDTHLRVLTVPAGRGYVLQIVRPLSEVDSLLDRARLVLILISLGGIVVAALIGALLAGAAVAPVRRLTRETEFVAATQDLGRRIEVHGNDELSRLGASFNTMLGALERSQRSQRQLVADASHELRTPLTSLRTNIEVLARARDMPEERREQLLRDVTIQLEEMTLLVSSLVELAADAPPDLETTEIRLDELAHDAVIRARRLAPQVDFRTDLHASLVDGVPGRLERAIANLLDNAVKWSPPGEPVEVRVAAGEVTVRDHGPGIDEADVPHVFDHFYRAPAARALPGSGLGLAIVRLVAEQHGGTVAVERAPGGGTLARLRLPELPPGGDAGEAARDEPAARL